MGAPVLLSSRLTRGSLAFAIRRSASWGRACAPARAAGRFTPSDHGPRKAPHPVTAPVRPPGSRHRHRARDL